MQLILFLISSPSPTYSSQSTCSHCTLAHKLCDMWRSTPSQKSRQNHRFYVWTEAIPGMVFAPAQFDTVWTSGHFSQVNHNSAEWRCVFNISFYVDIFQRTTLGDTYPRLFLTGVPLSLRTATAEFEIKFLFTRRLEYKNESFKVSRQGRTPFYDETLALSCT